MSDGSIYRALCELEESNRIAALCTVVRSQGSTPRHAASKMLVYPDGRILGSVGGGEVENRVIETAKQAILDGKSRLLEYEMSDPQRGDPGVCGGQVEVFVEPVQPKPVLLVIGAGHVGKAVSHLGRWLGFYVVVNDDRPAFCTPEAVPAGHAFYPIPMADLPAQLSITPWTYIILTTRGVSVDVIGLPALLDTPAAYIGVIGSRRRWKMACQQMIAAGVPPEKLDRIHSPVGLEIRAETPEEIAVSILAEVIMIRQGGDGSSMSSSNKEL